MQAIKNPIALDLADGVRKTVSQNEVVNDTLDRHSELLKLQNYVKREVQKAAQQAAEQAAKQAAEQATITSMEKMIVTAIQSNVQPEAIEAMRKTAGITDTRLNELKKQASAE